MFHSLSLISLILFNSHSSSIPKILISSSLHNNSSRPFQKANDNPMGNCIRHESPMQWGGDDWEDGLFSAPESGGDIAVAGEAEEELLGKITTNAAPSVAPAMQEVKIRITKRQLEELLGKPGAAEEKPVQQLVSQLMAISASDRFEAGQRSWRPALKSIPEVN